MLKGGGHKKCPAFNMGGGGRNKFYCALKGRKKFHTCNFPFL